MEKGLLLGSWACRGAGDEFALEDGGGFVRNHIVFFDLLEQDHRCMFTHLFQWLGDRGDGRFGFGGNFMAINSSDTDFLSWQHTVGAYGFTGSKGTVVVGCNDRGGRLGQTEDAVRRFSAGSVAELTRLKPVLIPWKLELLTDGLKSISPFRGINDLSRSCNESDFFMSQFGEMVQEKLHGVVIIQINPWHLTVCGSTSDDQNGGVLFVETGNEFRLIGWRGKSEHALHTPLVDQTGDANSVRKLLGSGVKDDGPIAGIFQIAVSAFEQVAAPSSVLQSDILQALGASMTVRSDTFIIRSYGDAVDANGEVTARAWCETVVQRVPDPVVADTDDVWQPAGQTFGRRIKLVSFRWLGKEEV